VFKHVALCRILNYDTQNEPPYLASTFEQSDVEHQCVLFEHVGWDFSSMILHLGLSHRITITFFFFMYVNPFMSFVIHVALLVACMFTMDLAYVVDKGIVGCCLLFQEMAPPPNMNTNPMVDFLSSRSPTQSASQYPTIFWGGNPLNHILNCKVPCRY
jgi:hypothetical protein